MDNIFQAKQTLQSIIDNYEGADLVEMAQDKLNIILEEEKIEQMFEESEEEFDEDNF
jgi:hypothetical protein